MQFSKAAFCLPALALMLVMTPRIANAETFDIDAGRWQQPRSASMVKSLPPVNMAIKTLLGRPGAQLVIRHRDDEEGTLWGAELRDWLVSLGIPPEDIRLEIMKLDTAALQLEVTATGSGL